MFQRNLFSCFVLFAFLAWPIFSLGAVWSSEKTWSPSVEEDYSLWVQSQWRADFFTHPPQELQFLKGLMFDCADVVYTMRMVYSYTHHLPFAVNDPSGGKKLLSNEMTRWDSRPEPTRVRAFIEYINQLTSTATLPDDTYPVAISRNGIRSGGLLLTDAKSHHSYSLQSVSQNGIPRFIYSSRPARTSLSTLEGYPREGFVFPRGILYPAGFRYFKPVDKMKVDAYKIESASDEQYKIQFGKFFRTVEHRLALSQEPPLTRMNRLMNEACRYLHDRVPAVQLALTRLAALGPGQCFSADAYDDLSTPNRDSRLQGNLEDVITQYDELKAKGETLNPEIDRAVATLKDSTVPALAAWCPLEYSPGKWLSAGQVLKRLQTGSISHNPHDDLEYRWGEKNGHSTRARQCPTYD